MEQLIGIYLGWRGESAFFPINWVTFYGRKSASQRIGTGDAADFLVRLNNIYRELNTESAEKAQPAGSPGRVTSLVVVGHSFGGALVLTAIEDQLQAALASARDDLRPNAHPCSPAPQSCSTTKDGTARKTFPLINGLGDLTILINPAIEAASYQPLFENARSADHPFSSCQSPILLTISSENDNARKMWFVLAQKFGTSFRATRGSEEDELRRALGYFPSQVTHTLTVVGEKDPPCPALSEEDLFGTEFHLGERHSFGEKDGKHFCLSPKAGASIDVDNPFIVANTRKEIASGHDSAFQEELASFLTRFITASAIKRQKHLDTLYGCKQQPEAKESLQ